MHHNKFKISIKMLSTFVVLLMIISIFSGTFAIIASKVDQDFIVKSNKNNDLVQDLTGENDYIVELMHPEDPAMKSDWYYNMLEKVQNYNIKMGWGNAGPAWYYDMASALKSGTRSSGSSNPLLPGSGSGPNPFAYVSGLQEVVVIACNFSDSPNGGTPNHSPDTHTTTWFNETVLFNETKSSYSMNQYFDETSYGIVNVTGKVAYNSGSTNGWYTSSMTRSAAAGSPKFFVMDAVSKADADINYKQFDKNSDGDIDHLIVIHAGDDRASSGDPNDIWSHRSYWWPNNTAGDGIEFKISVLVAESDPMGVFAHEFGHDLGLPDLYDTDGGTQSIVGKWALMDSGAWNKVSTKSRPAHPTAWSKEQLGWVTPIIISEANNNQGYHQVNQTTSPTNNSVCYRVDIPGFKEYWLIENRNKTTDSFDEGLDDRGIIIYHCMDKYTLLTTGPVYNGSWNDGPTKYPYYGTQLENPSNDANDPLYNSNKNLAEWSEASGNTEFNPYSAPASLTNNKSPTTVHIDNISDNSLWNMTFRVLVKDDEIPPAAPTNLAAFDQPNDNGNCINLTWDNSTDDYSSGDVTHYNIYMNYSGEGIDGAKYKIQEELATGASSYEATIAGLIDGVSYHFCVMADDGPNQSPCSNNATASPTDNIALPPTGFTVSDTFPDDGGNLTLTWGLSPHDPFFAPGGDIQGYRIYLVGTGLIDTVAPGTTTYKIGNLTNGVSYTYYIESYDEVNNDGQSPSLSAIPTDDTVGAPTGVNANPAVWTGTNSFSIDWVNPIDNSGLKNGAWYYIGSTPPTSQGDGTWTTNKPISITTAPEGRNYVYIWLEDDSGNPGNRDFTKYGFAQIRLDTTAPILPTNLDATPDVWTKVNSFSVDWDNPTEPVGETSGIKLGAWYKVGSPPTSQGDGTWQPIKPISVSAISEGQTVLYVWMEDNVGNRNYNNYNTVNLFLDITPPLAPINLISAPNTWTNDNSFDLYWTNPVDDAGIKGVYHKLDAQPFGNNDGVYTEANNINNLTYLTVSGEGAHPIYLWLLDNANNIDFQNFTQTTLYYDISAPTSPLNIIVTPNSWTNVNSFDLTWSNPVDLSGIKRVYYKMEMPPISDSDGDYVDADNISMLTNLNVSKEGSTEIYIWLEDYAGNVNFLSYNTATLYYDATPPSAPAVLIAAPGSWDNHNSFDLTWTNLADRSGIAGAYYKLNSPPLHYLDGIYTAGIGMNEILNVAVPNNGTHTVYVWLIDRAGNVDFLNYASEYLYYDAMSPTPPENLTVEPSYWTNVNSFNVKWYNPTDASGIISAFYRIGSQPRSNSDGFKLTEDNISQLSGLTVTDDGSYPVYIWLEDYAGNYDYTMNASTDLRYDSTPPRITHSKITSATAGVKVTIQAIYTDELTGVSASYLYYKNRNNNVYTEIPMSFSSGDICIAEIPAEEVTTAGLEYYLKVEDGVANPNIRYYGMYGQTISKPSSDEDIDVTVTIEDLTPPSIIHNEVTHGTFGVGIKITAIINDDASGVENASLFYKKATNSIYTEVTMGQSNPYSAEIPSDVISFSGLEYFIKTVDKASNKNTGYYGKYGQVSTQPNSTNDIDIEISDEDNNPPIITYGPVVTNITENSAVILWITDEPADSRINVGTTIDYNMVYKDDKYLTNHHFIIYDLSPATTYHYQASSTDAYGNGPTRSSDKVFTTPSSGNVDTDGDGIPDSTDQDDDNDGLPDEWETQHGLDPKDNRDSEMDNDGDGYSNRKEYLDNSNPLDPDSTPVTANDFDPPIIEHTPVTTGKGGKAIEITAIVTDTYSGVKAVTLYYKSQTSDSYNIISMGFENPYTAEISGFDVRSEGLEYYLMAEDHGFTPNIAYFGQDGLIIVEPTEDTDIDITVTGEVGDDDEDDGGILEDMGEPFGITNPLTCLLYIILLIIVLIAVVVGVWSAKKRMAYSREMEEHEKDKRFEPKDTEDEDLEVMGEEDIDWEGL